MSELEGIDPRLMHALSHPLRVRILSILGERVASPLEMAAELDEPLGNVSYHVTVLRDSDCIDEVRNEPRRGAVEHYFKANPRSSLGSISWDTLPPVVRQSLAAASFDTLVPQVVDALRAETFRHRDKSSFYWQPLSLDEPGWKEIAEIIEDVDARIKAVAKKSRRRLKAQDGFSVIAVVGALEIPREEDDEPRQAT
jgi:DNA-binding transcriptional ArsR family regulator